VAAVIDPLRWSGRPWWAALACVAPLACAPRAATQIVIRIDAEAFIASAIDRVEVSAFLEGQEAAPILGDAGYDLTQYGLPGDVVVAAQDPDEPRRLIVRVSAALRGGVGGSLEQRAVVPFRREQTQLLTVFLARQCLTAQCPGETCGNDGQCRPIDRPALGPYTPLDASVDRSPPSDALLDATAEPGAPADVGGRRRPRSTRWTRRMRPPRAPRASPTATGARATAARPTCSAAPTAAAAAAPAPPPRPSAA
jgi:hypothetical protein